MTIEKTPEQKVREFYESFKEVVEWGGPNSEHAQTTVYSIERTLKLLGIKIAGVNE